MLESESAPLFIALCVPYLAPSSCVKRPYLVPLIITRSPPDGGGPFVDPFVAHAAHAAHSTTRAAFNGGGLFHAAFNRNGTFPP